MPASRGIDPARDGTFHVRLPLEEREVLRSLPTQLHGVIDSGDDSARRLFPPAYDDERSDDEYRLLVGASLLDGKLAALAELERTADAERLTEPELESWLGALESLRLVLGTQLDVTEETHGAFDPAHPEAPRLALYHWLSWLQEEVVQALAARLTAGEES
jgi:hypothetical protein